MTDSYSRRIHFSQFLASQRCARKAWLDLQVAANSQRQGTRQQSSLVRYYDDQHQQLRQIFLDSLPLTAMQINAAQFSVRCEQTQQSISCGASLIVDACFESDGCSSKEGLKDGSKEGSRVSARVDILRKILPDQNASAQQTNTWQLILVKAAASVKNRHIEQAAFQYHVLSCSGIRISSVSVVTANRRFRQGDDLQQATTLHDVTQVVLDHQNMFSQKLETCRSQLADAEMPKSTLGRHCFKREKCAYYEKCWQGVGEFNLFMLPHLKPQLAQQLLVRDILDVDQMPPDAPLSDEQWRYVSLVKRRATDVDLAGLHKALASLQFPLFFLDFEADNAVIPRFKGQQAFAKTPFQFSCHRLDRNGTLEHHSYLHGDDTDPRDVIVEKLIEALSQEGSVVVWHAAFERARLLELAHFRAVLAMDLRSIVARLWDLEPVFKMTYQDYRFMGSSALKKITAVILPELDYSDLAITDGETVVACWNEMIHLPADQRQDIYQAIEDYCARDTLVMVKLLQFLQQLDA